MTFKSSHHPHGKSLTCLPRLTLAQLRPTLRSTTACTCRRDLENFASPPWETHVWLVFLAGRRYLGLLWHSFNRQLPSVFQSSSQCAYSCSRVPIAPMGKLLTCLPQLTLAQLRTLWSTIQGVRATETLKISHCPHGKFANVLAPTHACTTANASVNYRACVLQRP